MLFQQGIFTALLYIPFAICSSNEAAGFSLCAKLFLRPALLPSFSFKLPTNRRFAFRNHCCPSGVCNQRCSHSSRSAASLSCSAIR
jgi:hypothetical protein